MTVPSRRLRVLLGDDHHLCRLGFRKILEERPEWEVAEAREGREAVHRAAALQPDVAVLDLSMPKLDGIAATKEIVHRVPGVRVLILSMHAEAAYISRALQAGAAGYLLKDSAGRDLIDAVSTVASGGRFFTPAVVELIVDDYVRSIVRMVSDPFDALSERESEVLQLIAEGRSNRDVAAVLSISPATVETHRARIFGKLGVHSAGELALRAMREGVIS